MKDYNQYRLDVKKSPEDKRDFKASTIYRKIALPETLDYRSSMQPIRDQGNQSSCVAMSGSAMKEWQEQKDVGLNEYMSPQFIYNFREDTSEEGMYMRDLMKILNKKGDCTEKLYPYGTFTPPSSQAIGEAQNYIIDGYASVATPEELKTALFVNGPCVLAVPVYNYTTRMWYKRINDYFLGGHAMLVAGYNKEGFIIRNSWGTDWGDKGYCIMPYGDFSLAWEYWTTIDANSFYPPDPEPEPEPKKKWIDKYWWVLVLAVLGIGLIIGLIPYF